MNESRPLKLKKEFFDYIACRDFLESKYKIKERDYAGRYRHEDLFIEKTGFIKPPYYSVKNEKGQEYAYPINETGSWKFFIGNNDVGEKEWSIAKSNYEQWVTAFKEWESKNPTPEYQDFWRWILEFHDNISNGSMFTMYEDEAEAGTWQREILDLYMKEFGEGEIGNRKIEFYVAW